MKHLPEVAPPAAPVENQKFSGTIELGEPPIDDQLVEVGFLFPLSESKFEKLTGHDSLINQSAKAILIANIGFLITAAIGTWDNFAKSNSLTVDQGLLKRIFVLLILAMILRLADLFVPNAKSKTHKEIKTFFLARRPKIALRK